MVEGTEKIKNGHLDNGHQVETPRRTRVFGDMINQMATQLGETTVSKSFVEDIFRSIHDPVIVVNGTMVVEMANPAASAMLDLDEEKLIGKSLNHFINMPTAQPSLKRNHRVGG